MKCGHQAPDPACHRLAPSRSRIWWTKNAFLKHTKASLVSQSIIGMLPDNDVDQYFDTWPLLHVFRESLSIMFMDDWETCISIWSRSWMDCAFATQHLIAARGFLADGQWRLTRIYGKASHKNLWWTYASVSMTERLWPRPRLRLQKRYEIRQG